MEVQLQALAASAVLHRLGVVERIVLVFSEQQRVDRAAVLVDEAGLDVGEGGIGLDFEVLDLGNAFALVEQVDDLPGFTLQDRSVRPDCPLFRPLPS
ncbi:MAG: hypothetical protein IPK89_12340 [Sphingomonadales bacterium]|nr:hypothetical protein [Sphingomonadales bacterium]